MSIRTTATSQTRLARKKKSANLPHGTAVGTRRRIIERSIPLFNEVGLANVTIRQIADRMQISQGNLAYHFRYKRDLIEAALLELQDRLRAVLIRPADQMARSDPQRYMDDSREYLLLLMSAFWDFRFFFNGLVYVLSSDARLRRKYDVFEQWAIATMAEGIDYLLKVGIMVPLKDGHTAELVAENMWGLWLHWLRMTQRRSPKAAKLSGLSLYDGGIHHWGLMHALLEPKAAEQLRQIIIGYRRRNPG